MVAHNNINGAIDGMRQRYISVAVEIADALTVLAKSAAGAPPKARKTALAAIARIAAVQEKLSGETSRLPAVPEERLALLQSALQAQQGALVQLALIVKQLGVPDRSPRDQLSRYQLRQQPAATQLPNTDLARAVLVSRRIHSDELRPFTSHRPSRGTNARPPTRSKARGGGPSARTNRSVRRSAPVLLLKAAASRSLILVMFIASGLLVAYGSFPRASNVPRSSASNEVPTRGLEAATPIPVARTEPTKNPTRQILPSESSPEANTKQAVLAPVSPGVSITPMFPTKEASTPVVEAATPRLGEPRSASGPLLIKLQDPTASGARNDPSPAVTLGKQEGAAPKIETVAAIPPSSSTKEGFVAVLFTHKELATVKSALLHLQHSFPTLLQGRKSEIQAVDMGEKGVWHRLVLLPAGSREQAQTVCQGLMAAGYDRCWVKAN